MAYRHVTEEKRRPIYEWCQEGCRIRKITRLLRRAASSLGREAIWATRRQGLTLSPLIPYNTPMNWNR
ncbi:MAG: helix-turn-helix domain-containing protein [Verrucomicrobia bacterium]|nr:helix-turn-helix domain-containing protein [Verrucomicrobiota bacterium]MBU4366783.1 helix-turn-helix domain-containing protein [Verrucomicrobiota bacterium]